MKRVRNIVLLLVAGIIPFLIGAQSSGNSTGSGTSQAANVSAAGGASTGAVAQSASIRVLAPTMDEKLNGSSVSIRYELTNSTATAASSPNFRLQLDKNDPVETMTTTYSFSGLAPGAHVVTIDLVDANHTPINGSHAEVRFISLLPNPSSGGMAELVGVGGQVLAAGMAPSLRRLGTHSADHQPSEELANTGGAMPLLSIVGFGVLVGGIVSAMKTRHPKR